MSLDSARSAGSSGPKSKRSFNSSGSNLSSNSKKQKKKEANQKTLGAAWGATSLSSSRSSFRKSPFSDFGRSFLFSSLTRLEKILTEKKKKYWNKKLNYSFSNFGNYDLCERFTKICVLNTWIKGRVKHFSSFLFSLYWFLWYSWSWDSN